MSDILNAPFVIAILIALTVHEAAHALVANWLGDSTAMSKLETGPASATSALSLRG
jgi:ATP-dependent Zn protease